MNRLAEMESTSFANWTEAKKAVRVAQLNAAIDWAWRSDVPGVAFPFTVTSGTVAVTSGKIALSLLGEGTGCSLWDADPRPAGNTAVKVDAVVSYDGVYPVTEETSVFAFYRSAAPQGTYAEGGTYATPSTIPDLLKEMVPLQALLQMHAGLEKWDSVKGMKGLYGEPMKMKESLTMGLLNSGMPWQEHWLVTA